MPFRGLRHCTESSPPTSPRRFATDKTRSRSSFPTGACWFHHHVVGGRQQPRLRPGLRPLAARSAGQVPSRIAAERASAAPGWASSQRIAAERTSAAPGGAPPSPVSPPVPGRRLAVWQSSNMVGRDWAGLRGPDAPARVGCGGKQLARRRTRVHPASDRASARAARGQEATASGAVYPAAVGGRPCVPIATPTVPPPPGVWQVGAQGLR